MRRLILACSRKKVHNDTMLPAIVRYDGPMFRVLRNYSETSNEELEIYILSAKFGLIQHTRKIPYYDQKLTAKETDKLKAKVINQAKRLFADEKSRRHKTFVSVGKTYWNVLEPVFEFLDDDSLIKTASGSSGKRLAELHDWLYISESALLQKQKPTQISERINFRGVEISLDKHRLITIAQNAINNCDEKAFDFQSWYIEVEGFKLSPKWIVSKLTHLPVSNFHSHQAVRILTQLGIEVMRV